MSTDIFLTIDDIKGESQDLTNKDWIDVVTWHWGLAQGGTAHSGTGGGSGKVSVRDITIVKLVDRASPNLIKLCCSGKHFSKAELVFRKAGGQALEYLKLELSDGLVSAVSYAANWGDERLGEQVSLNFASFKCEYSPQSKDGLRSAVIPAQWNVAKNSES
jgi:type VI secretion system secreted protein Hcp